MTTARTLAEMQTFNPFRSNFHSINTRYKVLTRYKMQLRRTNHLFLQSKRAVSGQGYPFGIRNSIASDRSIIVEWLHSPPPMVV
jgi:hypothetical protein